MLLVAIALLANGAKLIHISADFPSSFTWSGFLFTDEGWHSGAAVNWSLGRGWIVPGETLINMEFVAMPVGQLIKAAAFQLSAVSLASARLPIALSSIGMVGLVWVLCRRHAGSVMAATAAAVVSVNFFLFLYARVAVHDTLMVMLVVAALAIGTAPHRRDGLLLVAAGFVLALAILAKTTALYGLPVLAYAVSTRAQDWREKISLAGTALSSCVVFLAAYAGFALQLFGSEFVDMHNQTIGVAVITDPQTWLRNAWSCVREARVIGPVLYPAALVLGIGSFFASGTFRRDRLVQIALVWCGAVFLVVASSSYHPDRYFVSLAVPVAIVFAAAVMNLPNIVNRRAAAIIQSALIAAIIVADGARIARHVAYPEFSFAEMGRGVARAIQDDGAPLGSVMLIGVFASSVGVATGLPSVDSSSHPVIDTVSLDWKVRTHSPNYLVTLGPNPEEASVLQKYYRLDVLGRWDVLDNYINGDPVYLFRLKRESAAGGR